MTGTVFQCSGRCSQVNQQQAYLSGPKLIIWEMLAGIEFPGMNCLVVELLGYVCLGSLITVVIYMISIFLNICQRLTNDLISTLQKHSLSQKSFLLPIKGIGELKSAGMSMKPSIPEGQVAFSPVMLNAVGSFSLGFSSNGQKGFKDNDSSWGISAVTASLSLPQAC